MNRKEWKYIRGRLKELGMPYRGLHGMEQAVVDILHDKSLSISKRMPTSAGISPENQG